MATRRTVLSAVACLPLLATASALEAVEVAPGIFVLPGGHQDAMAENSGAIANVGFVVGEQAVAVIDPGGSHAHGMRLRQAISAVTSLPVRHLILTHVHPDHIMGAAAFADLQPDIIGHVRLPEALAQRDAFYRAMLTREMGETAAGSAPLAPSRLVEDHTTIDLGGRVLDIEAQPPAHTDHDLVVFDRASETLWLSDLLFIDRIPALDGDLHGWLRVLGALQARPAARAVPGHGPPAVTWPDTAAPLVRYLVALRDGTRAAINAGIGLAEAPARVATTEATRWLLAESYHGRNVMVAYRQLVWE